MITLREEYLVDEAGNREAVVLPLAAWQQIKEELEELDDIRAYDEAKAQPSEPVPFGQAGCPHCHELPDRTGTGSPM